VCVCYKKCIFDTIKQIVRTIIMKIQEVKLESLSRVHALAKKTWFNTYKSILEEQQLNYMFNMMYKIENLEHNVKKGSSYYIIRDKVDLGFIEIIKKEYIIKLNKIYVIPNQQGKGLGENLIRFICDIAKNKKITQIELNVNRYNKAIKFYLKQDFKIIKEENIEIGNGYLMEDYVMRKIIIE